MHIFHLSKTNELVVNDTAKETVILLLPSEIAFVI